MASKKTGTKVRNYVFTSFEIPGWLEELPIKYSIYGEEICPKTNTKHWQGYMELTRPMELKTITNLLNKYEFKPAHFETRKGSAKQAIDYCKKDGLFTEFGEPKKQGERNDLAELVNIIQNGGSDRDLIEANPGSFIRYHKGLDRVRGVYQHPRKWRTKVTVLWGVTGAGKSYKAFELAGDSYDVVSYHNGFIQGYTNKDTVIIEEFECKNWKRNIFLQMVDAYPMKVNIKGGELEWNPKHIIFTSNFDPKDWFAIKEINGHFVETLKRDPAVYRRLHETEGNNVEYMGVAYASPLTVPDENTGTEVVGNTSNH